MARPREPRSGGVRPHRADGRRARPSPDDEPDLLDHVHDLVKARDPIGLVIFASSIVSALEPGPALPFQHAQEDDDPSLAEIIDSFVDVPRRETTALLAVLAPLVTDDLLRRNIRRELDRRGGPLPAGLDRLEPLSVDRTVAATHVLGHVDTLVVGVRSAAGQTLTIVVIVDHELGTLVADGFAYPGPAEVAVTRLVDDDDPDLTVADIDPANTRARIAEAIETGRVTYPPLESDTWPECRPLVEWVLRALPEGGSGRVRPELDEAQRQEIARRFFASAHGRQHDHPDGRSLLDTLLWYGCDYGTGDPLTWSAEAVAILLDDWLPRKVIAEPAYLDLAPDLLRRFIRFAHEERGLREELTEDALEFVNALEPEYRRVIRTERPQGPAALMAAMGWLDDDATGGGPLGDLALLGGIGSHHRSLLDLLALTVGSDDVTASDSWEPDDARDDGPFWGGPADDGDPREGPDRFDRTVALDLGVDPAPPTPWRQDEPVDVLAVGWFPPGAFEDAVDRWPELAARVGTRGYATYARIVQGTLIDVARERARHPVLVSLDPEELLPLATATGLEVTDWRTRAALAAELAEAGQAVTWPPGRNDPCWCGSGRKYKKCCDTVPVDPARRATPTDAHGMAQAFELDITLVGARPRIWRRIAIAADATFGDLHHAIQVACDWDDDHLFAFATPTGTEIGGSPYEDPFGDPHPDAAEVPLAGYFTEHDRCQYEYDFGDGWHHDIRVVRRIEEPVDYRQQLLDGARAFPPEDCGGLPGYEECVAVATGGDDPYDRREWLGDWDPERFNLAELKQRFDR